MRAWHSMPAASAATAIPGTRSRAEAAYYHRDHCHRHTGSCAVRAAGMERAERHRAGHPGGGLRVGWFHIYRRAGSPISVRRTGRGGYGVSVSGDARPRCAGVCLRHSADLVAGRTRLGVLFPDADTDAGILGDRNPGPGAGLGRTGLSVPAYARHAAVRAPHSLGC